MNIFKRMGILTKLFLIVSLVCGMSYVVWKHQDKIGFVLTPSNSDNIIVGLNSWAGFAALPWVNGGMITTDNSIMRTMFNGNLVIKQIDIRKDAINALKNDKVDMIWCTVDVLPIEMEENSDFVQLNVKNILKIDDSRGADVIVVNESIKSVQDMRNKKVVFGRGTASHTLLLSTLETANMTINDIIPIEVSDGIEAVKVYINGGADVAVVWSPDDGDCISSRPGSWVLTSTKYATSIIMDGLLVKNKTLENKDKFEQIVRICQAWLYANGQLNISEENRQSAAETFVKSFEGTDAFVVLDGINKVRFSSYGDNIAFFGLDSRYTGVTGNDLYTKMARIYGQTRDNGGNLLTRNPIPWNKIYDTRVIEAIPPFNTPEQQVEGITVFMKKDNLEQSPVISGKNVTINFETNSSLIDDYNRSIIDREIGSMAKFFGGARIRVEGNTDITGNRDYNIKLSYDRAKSIVDYLIKRYNFNPDKFVIVGNGPDKPVADNKTEHGKSLNRRTDVFIIKED
jgi:NitT/TauT family transport system substrate-binding protein